MSIAARLALARQQLIENLALPSDTARIEARALLSHAMGGVSRAWLICHEELALSAEQRILFDGLLYRRLQGEPVAYIIGAREFYGLDFRVSPAVLIPRPDTETLVEAALQRIPDGQPCRVLDLGTGSGAIAIAIAAHRPQAVVTAVDRSGAAVELARGNAERLGTCNLRLLQSDWFEALQGQMFDVIASNPPYIALADPHLAQGDLRFEPPEALVSGVDGLEDIRAIVARAPMHLASGGWLLLEHGHDQAEPVAALLAAAGLGETGHATDLAGIRRVTLGRRVRQGGTY